MDPPQNFKSLQDQIQTALISTTRTSGQISAEDLTFIRSLDPAVGIALTEQSERLLALSTSLLKSAASISQLNAPSLEDLDDVENNWKPIVDVVDSLLEKADTCLDEYTGVRKRKSPPDGDEVCSSSKLRSYFDLPGFCRALRDQRSSTNLPLGTRSAIRTFSSPS